MAKEPDDSAAQKPAAKAKWFHPRGLLDRTYEIGLFVKGFDGTLELLGGLLLILVPGSVFLHLTRLAGQTS